MLRYEKVLSLTPDLKTTDMKRILVYEPFHAYNYFCKSCGYETPHMAAFLSYFPKKHMVEFQYYCQPCFEQQGDETLAYKISLPINDWIKLVESKRPDN